MVSASIWNDNTEPSAAAIFISDILLAPVTSSRSNNYNGKGWRVNTPLEILPLFR